MKNNYLKYCLFPAVLFIALVISNMLGTYIHYSIFEPVNPVRPEFVDWLKLLFSLNNLCFSLIGYLPIVAVATLFTIQDQHLKIDLRNTVYIGIICLICMVIMLFFKLWIWGYLVNVTHYLNIPSAGVKVYWAWDFFCYVVAMAVIGAVSYYYFKNHKASKLVPLSRKVTIFLILITQVILVNYLCTFSVTPLITQSFAYFSQAIIYPLIYLLVFLINFVVLFIYFYAWNHSYLVGCNSLDNFAMKTTMSFVIMSVFMLFLCLGYGFTLMYFMLSFVVISYIVGFAIFIFMIKQSKFIPYLILCCLAYFAPLVFFFFIGIPYMLFIYGVYVGVLSISLFSWCISNKLAMRLVFK